MQNVKVVDDEVSKLHKSNVDSSFPTTYDNISNNPFFGLKLLERDISKVAVKMSGLVTKWVREASEISMS